MDESQAVSRMLFTLRVVVMALAGGVVGLVLIALFVVRPQPDPETGRFLLVALGGLVAAELVAWPIVRRGLTTQIRRSVDGLEGEERERALLSGFFTSNLIPAAMIEGATIFSVVIYLVSASQPALLAAAVGGVLLLSRLPTAERYRSYVERLSGHAPL